MAVTISYKAQQGCVNLNTYIQQQPIQAPIENILLATAKALRENPELRTVQCSIKLIEKVSEITGGPANPETVTRSRRHIQNKLKLYLPIEDDGRRVLEQQYRGAFR